MKRLAPLPPWLVPLAALLLLVALVVGHELATRGHSTFLRPENLLNILRQWSVVGILAVGMTFVITLGGIDLSVGSLLAFLGGLGILAMNAAPGSELAGVLLGFATMLAAGVAAGLLHGLLVTRGGVAPFIATLGGLAAYRSAALAMVDGGEYRSQSPTLFAALGNGGIPIPGTNVAPRAPEPIPLLAPWAVILFAAVALIGWFVLNRTRLGRYVVAIGCNERAARYAAVSVTKVKIATYALLGGLTGVGAMLQASRMNSISSSGTGVLVELDVIAAVVIGGTKMRGGSGTIVGTVVGVLILGVIGNMLTLLQVSPYLQGLVKGSIIVGAVLLQRAERSD